MTPPPRHPAGLDDAALLARCEHTFGRASGPGGQHRNKVETAVRLVDQPTGLVAQATERRSREQNQRVAVRRMRLKLATEHRVSVTPEAGPTALWQSRRAGTRIVCSAEHADFPALLAEALDRVFACALSAPDAAEALGVSSSQLIKLIAKEPAALAHWNAARQAVGLKPLKA